MRRRFSQRDRDFRENNHEPRRRDVRILYSIRQRCSYPHYYTRFYNVYYVLFYSILFYSILFYSILFYSILFYSILSCSIYIYDIVYHIVLYHMGSFEPQSESGYWTLALEFHMWVARPAGHRAHSLLCSH